MPSQADNIRSRAFEILGSQLEGTRYTELVRRIADLIPGINPKSIPAIIWDLDKRFPDKVYKPARGVFRVRKFVEDQNQPAPTPPVSVPVPARIEERAFYEAVADYLMKELEECTKAIPLGGNRFRDKWGTPDVIGVLKASPTDVLKFSEQIVSAEIKVDSADLITAFGQACAYKLFSHRSYIVVPRNSPAEDIARLDALCLIFGIGLILFDASNISAPDFQIRARAVRHEPDMFYVNKNIPDDVR
jgi:hypothetical protein